MVRRLVCTVQIGLLFLGCLSAQTSRPDKVKSDVGKIGTLGQITVYMPDGHEYYGTVVRIDNDDFAVNEVDEKREITLRYGDVKKVRSGYGNNSRTIAGKRVHPRTKLITTVAVVGGLLILAIVALANDHS